MTIFARIVRIFGGESLVLGGWGVCAPLRERRRGVALRGRANDFQRMKLY